MRDAISLIEAHCRSSFLLQTTRAEMGSRYQKRLNSVKQTNILWQEGPPIMYTSLEIVMQDVISPKFGAVS